MSEALSQVLSGARISDVAKALGYEPKHGRITAPWRKTKDCNVGVNDAKNTYCDYADGNRGGGLLDFISRIQGCSNQDALKWLADFQGIALDDQPQTPEARRAWKQQQQDLEKHGADAGYWRRAVVLLTEEALNDAKSRFFDPIGEDRPASSELELLTRLLSRLESLEGMALVREYQHWLTHARGLALACVQWARVAEAAERRALLAYLRECGRQAA